MGLVLLHLPSLLLHCGRGFVASAVPHAPLRVAQIIDGRLHSSSCLQVHASSMLAVMAVAAFDLAQHVCCALQSGCRAGAQSWCQPLLSSIKDHFLMECISI